MSQHNTLTLEPCPFCGAQPEQCDVGDHVVTCPSCGVDGPYGAPSGVAGAIQGWNRRAALSATQPAQAAQSADERAMLEMIDERDRCHEWADQLASAIAEHTCHEIGEHTSANNPWRMALNALECHERQDTTHEAGARIKDLEAQAAQPVQVVQGVPEFVSLSARIKELITERGTLRAVSRSFGIDVGYLSRLEHGNKVSPSPEVLAKLGVRDAGTLYERLTASPTPPAQQAAQGAGEVVAWQASDGGSSYISNEARSRNSAFRELYTIPLYTQPAAGADVPDMVEIMALADSYRNATCQEATASAREWLRAAIAASGRQE